jgi:hypothetical protein
MVPTLGMNTVPVLLLFAAPSKSASSHAKERVEHVMIGPAPANVAAKMKSGPTERRRRIDRRWRGIR